ncbi:LacI family DNA-binding transcriptional regulator [Flavivirga abyssicola]|uniref:LacI family DNA-binding transcriptional regulator n=1 Tax=Flavivirga abyssicola TaxID=3063533 RepID=UPI0026DF529E|nr:LacI family DNA-binding transcriptional regulator [Flavivirga sp. MEBiC07777]WVK12647.1 LacI family DNA-binding transcriptional regulator [Flavivirga sp. MEBiC07777]
MGKGKATIHDISNALGIDSSTVSRALNDSPRVSKKTKKRILDKANELGYLRNSLASNLRTNKTQTIAVVLPRVSRHFFATVIAGIEETAYEAGYNVIICQSLDNLKREKKIMNTLISNRVDGIMISIAMETTSYEHFEAYRDLEKPIVFFDRPCALKDCYNIKIDNFQASYNATEHLISKGCRHIVHLSGSQDIELYRQRKKGYIEALIKHGIEVNPNYIFESNLSEQDGIASAKKILELNTIDGIYSANDTSAISAIQYLKSQNIKIPEDIAVVGFNNDPISAVIDPSLTTINQPAFQMGKIASTLLLDQINNEFSSTKIVSKVLDSELIIRNSSKRI